MSRYHENAKRAEYNNTDPTETDQSQGHETDINVIVGRYGIGQVTSGNDPATGQYIDWTVFPRDLKEMIETARSLERHRAELPEQLREMPINDILNLTNEQLTTILTPPAPPAPPAPPTDTNGGNK